MLVTRVARTVFEETMEKAFRLLEQRSLRPGRGNHQYWYLSAACSLAAIQFEPERAQALEKQATDRVCKLLYKMLSLQVDDGEVNVVQEVSLHTAHWACVSKLTVNRLSLEMAFYLRRLLLKDRSKPKRNLSHLLMTHRSTNSRFPHLRSWMMAQRLHGCWTTSGSWMGCLL